MACPENENSGSGQVGASMDRCSDGAEPLPNELFLPLFGEGSLKGMEAYFKHMLVKTEHFLLVATVWIKL